MVPTLPMPTSPRTPLDVEPLGYVDGEAGASARAEFQRRHDRRDQRVRDAHPRLGGALLAIYGDPQPTKAWDVGAVGEEKLGAGLSQLAGPTVRVLHDRRIPGSRANIDHIVVCPSGVYVIDAKRYQGKPDVRFEGGLLKKQKVLVVGGRRCTPLVEGMHKQVAVVAGALGDVDVPLHGILCFVDADWGLLTPPLSVDGVRAMWPRKLRSWIKQAGPLDEATIDLAHRRLATALPRSIGALA